MNKISWPWIAGFFEGEGHVYWREGFKGTKQGMSGRIIIGQKCKAPLLAIRDFLTENSFYNPILYLRPARMYKRHADVKVETHGPIWILTLNWRGDVIRFLDEVIPLTFDKVKKGRYVRARLLKANAQRARELNLGCKLLAKGYTINTARAKAHVGRAALLRHALANEISIPKRIPFDREKWNADRIEGTKKGLCYQCGRPRKRGSTAWLCVKHARKYRAYVRDRKRQIRNGTWKRRT